MRKAFVGPQLRQLRRERKQTQAQMAKALGCSTAYVTLLENNQRSLSVQMLMAVSDAYGVDWRDILKDDTANVLADLRHAMRDPIFRTEAPDVQELRAAIDHAPGIVDRLLHLHRGYRAVVERVMRRDDAQRPDSLLLASPEAVVHDVFRMNQNHFPVLEAAAESIRAEPDVTSERMFVTLRQRLLDKCAITVTIAPIEEMDDRLRVFDRDARSVVLSEALDYQNRKFQLAHMVGLVEYAKDIEAIITAAGITDERAATRCRAELANYFAAAVLMPYGAFLESAEASHYDIDLMAARFGTSFEQVCHRLTTLQRDGALGVPFFFLRVDKAGNVTKRFNSTSFNLAEHGGSCPRWDIHMAFRAPDVIVPQFVELPDGERFFTISRTVNRAVYSRQTQDMRLAVSLGCEMRFAERIGYAASYNTADPGLITPIGISCYLCPRRGCAQRAHQPLHLDLPVDTDRRGTTRFES